MKKTVITGACATALAILAAGCSDLGGSFGSGAGTIAPSIGIDNEAKASKDAPRSRAEYADVTVDDLSVKLTKLDGTFMKTWDKVADFPVDQQFSVGRYTMEAFYGDPADQGFGKPAFKGEQTFEVADGQQTSLALTAQLVNTLFTVNYTDAFKGYMTAWSASFANDGGTVEYPADATSPVYLAPGKVTLSISVTKPNGLQASFEVATVEAQPRYHYTVTVDVNDGNVGDATLNISFSEDLATEVVEINLDDKLLSAAAPAVEADGFTPGTPVDFVAGLGSDAALRMNIVAMAGIKEVTLATESAPLLRAGWPAEIDLIAAGADQQALLTSLGFSGLGLWRNPDKMAVADFSGVVEHILPQAGENTTVFTITVKDVLSRVSEPMALTLNVESPRLELTKIDESFTPGENFAVQLSFNGGDVDKNVAFEYIHQAGRPRPLTVVSVEAVSRAMNEYKVTLASPDVNGSITVNATCKGVTSSLEVQSSPFEIAGNYNDTYATRAYVTVAGTEGNPTPAISDLTFQYKTADGEYTAATAVDRGSYVEITGLPSNSDILVRALLNGKPCRAVALHTEEQLQVPNPSFEETGNGTGNYNEQSFTGWGTNNTMTTSQGISSGSYARISGTVSNSSGHNGKCAELRTAAWGSGNRAWLSVERSTVKYFDAGLLHLGATRTARPSGYSDQPGYLNTDDLDCGIDFASRPSKVSFWYRYEPKNGSDQGLAEVWVKSATGAVIAQKTVSLGAASSFTKYDISLDYPLGTVKGAKIYVRFQSTSDATFLEQKGANFTLTTAQHILGSHLYIDDIELTY